MEFIDQIFFWSLYVVFCINLPIAVIGTLIICGMEAFKITNASSTTKKLQKFDANKVLLNRLLEVAPEAFINWFLWPRQIYRLIKKKSMP